MSRKRRMFDIDVPEEPQGAGGVSAPGQGDRRGPMASAVRETADSLRDRSVAEREIRAENDALAHEYMQMKGQGLVIARVPLDRIKASKLARDRRALPVEELNELKTSIAAIGLSNPVQLERDGEAYELVQGLRRFTAFVEMNRDEPDAGFDTIPAVVLEQGEDLEKLYRRMVDENLVRADISFAEMAMLARSYAADPQTPAQNVDAAVDALYGSVGKQKRSYIRGFAKLLDALETHLEYPEAIPRALGLAVRKKIEADPPSLLRLQRALSEEVISSRDRELSVLKEFAGDKPKEEQSFPAGNSDRGGQAPRPARTTFQVEGPQGSAKCTASQGRLEIRLDADFSAMDRRRLEEAVSGLLAALDGTG